MPEEFWSYPARIIAHCFFAVVAAFIVGIIPELLVGTLYRSTFLEAFSPAVAITALLLGYFFGYKLDREHLAGWTWICGLIWLLIGIHELTSSWSPSWSHTESAWRYARTQLFGSIRLCSDSECLYELFFTTPFTISVTYSLGGFLKKYRQEHMNCCRG
jgi:hypothetical protein